MAQLEMIIIRVKFSLQRRARDFSCKYFIKSKDFRDKRKALLVFIYCL